MSLRIPKSTTNLDAYDHHIITLRDDDAVLRLAVDVFDDGSVHIYDQDNRTSELQMSLKPVEVSHLADILLAAQRQSRSPGFDG